MASVSLEDVWVHDGTNLANYVVLGTSELKEKPQNFSETRRYSGGRFRLISVAGTQNSLQLIADLVNRIDLEVLRGWIGQLVLVRDPFGRKVWCTYNDIDVREVPTSEDSAVFKISISVKEVTVDETA